MDVGAFRMITKYVSGAGRTTHSKSVKTTHYWWCRKCMKEVTEKSVCKIQHESGIHVGCRGMTELWDTESKYHPKRIDELETEHEKHARTLEAEFAKRTDELEAELTKSNKEFEAEIAKCNDKFEAELAKRTNEFESLLTMNKPRWQLGKPVSDRMLCRVKKYVNEADHGVGWYFAEDDVIAGVCGDWFIDPTKEEWMIIPEAPKNGK
jgi:hypothetical protein